MLAYVGPLELLAQMEKLQIKPARPDEHEERLFRLATPPDRLLRLNAPIYIPQPQ
jgi:hypothetical protein